MPIEFFMPMEKVPTVTHQEKKWRVVNGKPVPYEPDEVKLARAKLRAHLGRFRPADPTRGGVALVVKWCFPRGEHADGEYRHKARRRQPTEAADGLHDGGGLLGG